MKSCGWCWGRDIVRFIICMAVVLWAGIFWECKWRVKISKWRVIFDMQVVTIVDAVVLEGPRSVGNFEVIPRQRVRAPWPFKSIQSIYHKVMEKVHECGSKLLVDVYIHFCYDFIRSTLTESWNGSELDNRLKWTS